MTQFLVGNWIQNKSNTEWMLLVWHKQILNVFKISKNNDIYNVSINGITDQSTILTNDNIENFKMNIENNEDLTKSIIDSWINTKDLISDYKKGIRK